MYKFELPIPPSANRYWRNVRGNMVVSSEAKHYKHSAGWLAKAAGVREPLTGPVAVMIGYYRPERRGDLDNRLKCLLDALNGIAYTDDSQVVAIISYRQESPKNGRIEICVKPVPAMNIAKMEEMYERI